MIAAAGMRRPEDLPERYRDLSPIDYTGDSCIIDPRGEVIAGPVRGETILTARGSLEAVYAAKVACDVGGHYSRPDVFQLLVNRRPLERLTEQGRAQSEASTRTNGHGETRVTTFGAIQSPEGASMEAPSA